MIRAIRTARRNTNGLRTYPLAAYYLLSGNFLLTALLTGVVFVTLGGTLIAHYSAVFGAMFGVWGFTLIAFGLVSHAVLWMNTALKDVRA